MTHKSAKFETFKPFCFSFLRWHVKGSPSKHIALKTDVREQENTLFAGSSVHHSAPEVLQAEAVKGLNGLYL